MHFRSIYILFIVLTFSIFISNVNALSKNEVMNSSINVLEVQENCEAVFGDPEKEGDFAHYLQQIFNVMKFLAPALVIVLSIIEFIKAAASDDKDALMKSTKKTGIRLFLALLLFFLPTVINFLFELLGWYGTCGIG